ncbi:MAG: hypothetical protein WCF83_16595 [Pseudolabrys sp.]
MSEKEKDKSEIQILCGAFEGMKGRQPRSDQELNEWLAIDEGKEATIFEATALSTWGDKARSNAGRIVRVRLLVALYLLSQSRHLAFERRNLRCGAAAR